MDGALTVAPSRIEAAARSRAAPAPTYACCALPDKLRQKGLYPVQGALVAGLLSTSPSSVENGWNAFVLLKPKIFWDPGSNAEIPMTRASSLQLLILAMAKLNTSHITDNSC